MKIYRRLELLELFPRLNPPDVIKEMFAEDGIMTVEETVPISKLTPATKIVEESVENSEEETTSEEETPTSTEDEENSEETEENDSTESPTSPTEILPSMIAPTTPIEGAVEPVRAFKWDMSVFTYTPDDVLNILYNGLFEFCHWYEGQALETERTAKMERPITIDTAIEIYEKYWIDPYRSPTQAETMALSNTVDDYAETFGRRFIHTLKRYRRRD